MDKSEIKLFYFGDNPTDWVMAETLDQARQHYIDVCGIDPAEVDPDDYEQGEVLDEKLDKLTFVDPERPGWSCSFREEFNRELENHKRFPQMFASTEY